MKITEELLNDLKSISDINVFIGQNTDKFDENIFTAYLNELISSRGLKPADIVNKADISNSYYYNVVKGERVPSRDTVIKLAFGLELSLEETQRLLKLSGLGELYPRKKRDSIIYFCVEKKYDLATVNEILDEFKQEML